MSTVELLEPLLEKGIANTNFFNGRLLSAEDLRAEQVASRQQHQQLGRAVGDGIAYGLEVRQVIGSPPAGGSSTPTVRVAAGLAINRAGQALSLAEDTDVALVRKLETVAAQAGLFAACEPQQTSALLTGKGVYVLALAPASGLQGRAPMSGLGQTVASGACGSRFAVEGVQFKLLSLNLSKITGVVQMLSQLNLLMASNTAINLSKLRNLLAHLSLGSEELKTFYGDPFGRENGRPTYLNYGAADALRKEGNLSDCDVPLALLYWTTQGIQFLDMWSVRRCLAQRAMTDSLAVVIGQRRTSEAEARLAQFEEHIEYLRLNQTNLESMIAAQWFGFLPALGLLPIKGTGSPAGFNPQIFFGSRASNTSETISGSILRALLRQSLDHDPIDLSGAEEILLYSIAENQKAIADNKTNQLAALFVSSALRQAIFALTLTRNLRLTFTPAFFDISGRPSWFFRAGAAFFSTKTTDLRHIRSEMRKLARAATKAIDEALQMLSERQQKFEGFSEFPAGIESPLRSKMNSLENLVAEAILSANEAGAAARGLEGVDSNLVDNADQTLSKTIVMVNSFGAVASIGDALSATAESLKKILPSSVRKEIRETHSGFKKAEAKALEAEAKIREAREVAETAAEEDRFILAIPAQCLGWMPVKLPQGTRIESLTVYGHVDGAARAFKAALARQRASDSISQIQSLVELSLSNKSGDLEATIQINDPASREDLIVDNATYEYLVISEARVEEESEIQIFSIQVGCARV